MVAVLAAAVTIFVFVYFKLWGLIPLGVGCLFAGLMFLFKRLQEREELKKNPPAPKGDFITGRIENNSDGTE